MSGCIRSGWAIAPTIAKAASYTAQDLMIVERDIGRLAKYTFDMGGAGDLLSLSLSVPPWEDLHELSRDELRLTNLVTTDAVADVLPQTEIAAAPVAELAPKPVQDRFVSSAAEADSRVRSRRNRPRPPKPWFRPAACAAAARRSSGQSSHPGHHRRAADDPDVAMIAENSGVRMRAFGT